MRFGFVVGKKVGNAVVRNQVRRRMRAAAYRLIRNGVSGVDVVVRGIPASVDVSVDEYEQDFRRVVVQP